MNDFRFLLLALPVLLAACSGIKPYPDLPNKNVHLHTTVSDNSLLTSMHADVDIYTVDAKCEVSYVGSVELSKPDVDIALPVGQQAYLMFVFSSKGMLGGVQGSTSYATLLRPRAGVEYRAEVRYKDDIYNVELFEGPPRGKGGRELAPRRLESCRG
ncbi:MAG TPA: hypothetical protein VFR06_02470 [Gallionellaceae bacterium]|nr:hypothetical protein [Gallionellaceae bacterium]